MSIQRFLIHPDISAIRKNYAKYYDAMENMDRNVGEALAKLEAAGLAENTIVIYCSDHGGVMPRSKRFLLTPASIVRSSSESRRDTKASGRQDGRNHRPLFRAQTGCRGVV